MQQSGGVSGPLGGCIEMADLRPFKLTNRQERVSGSVIARQIACRRHGLQNRFIVQDATQAMHLKSENETGNGGTELLSGQILLQVCFYPVDVDPPKSSTGIETPSLPKGSGFETSR
ncbi:hypothetical protein SRABI35_02417 [Stenotrophomonas lactitubi]|nr:hypothetical protein SRABI35_02417 [Stenotrophomonas lactitubi]